MISELPSPAKQTSRTAKVVAAYFAVVGLVEICVGAATLFSSSGSASSAAGVLTAKALLQIPTLAAAIGIARQRSWGTWLGAVMLAVTTFTFIAEFERGASSVLYAYNVTSAKEKSGLLASVVSIIWHGFWATLLYVQRPYPLGLRRANNSFKPNPLRGSA